MQAPLLTKSVRRQSAFTLVEIILVLSIIAILMGTVIYSVVDNIDDAKDMTVKTSINALSTSVKRYEMSNLSAPTTEEGLEALVNPPPKARAKRQVLKELPVDPWGQSFKYRNPGIHNTNSYDIYSIGSDKKEGTDDDIGNWSDTK